MEGGNDEICNMSGSYWPRRLKDADIFSRHAAVCRGRGRLGLTKLSQIALAENEEGSRRSNS